ncbi:MAG: hypothetical protein EOO06_08110 [Chitinophagaceae bacterium]|nr:MAG: hypothetical protein EOO06_08110 [Chitinophagaceae bacterium]
MKPSNLLVLAACGLVTCFTSCKKDSSTLDADSTIETTFELSNENAAADYMTEEDNDLLMEVTADQNLQGNGFAPTSSTDQLIPCANVTVSAGGFPKTILINFDSTCTSPRGLVRKGLVRIVVSDSLRRPGSTAVMTFENYFVNGFKREATSTWRNTSIPPVRSWERKVENGKITAPSGIFWLHQSIRNVTQTAGSSTPAMLDDVFSIAGNGSITRPGGVTRTATIIEPLQKKYICANIDKGKIRFQGPNHFAVLNYGDGECDRIATISIDGRPPRTILLR